MGRLAREPFAHTHTREEVFSLLFLHFLYIYIYTRAYPIYSHSVVSLSFWAPRWASPRAHFANYITVIDFVDEVIYIYFVREEKMLRATILLSRCENEFCLNRRDVCWGPPQPPPPRVSFAPAWNISDDRSMEKVFAESPERASARSSRCAVVWETLAHRVSRKSRVSLTHKAHIRDTRTLLQF